MIDSALLQEKNLWNYLKNTDLPIVIYGMGNGADKILEILAYNHISVADFFASDGFVRGHSFHGKKVLSFSEIQEKYEKFIILLAFGSSRADVMASILSISEKHELYAPDVPVCTGELFDANFYLQNQSQFEAVRSLLADEKSKEVYDDLISYKLSGNIAYLCHADTEKEDALKEILSGDYTAYADLGAYNGDTVKEALAFYPTIKKITAFEPSVKTFAKLNAYLSTLTNLEIQAYPLCAWDKKETVVLTDGSGRNTAIGGGSCGKTKNGAKIHTSECDSLDRQNSYRNEKLLIKYDVEGAEWEAILGSVQTIRNNQTEMIVSLYHKSADLFALPLLVHEILPSHKLYLRKHPYFPAWDINLYVCL
ncbi:MAG: FkbM family methyltransferase [Ruminococcaceae bacterium]|nr:FkbM family methyltransferase [Oscillospiraceae bacterium]